MQLNLLARVADQDAASRLTTAFYEALEDGHWHLRRDLCRAIPGLTERAARLIAERSGGQVIGGAAGYKLTRHCTIEELNHFERAQLSQVRKTINRVRLTRIARNRGGVAA